MRRFNDASGLEWTAALSGGSYGSITLLFSASGDTAVYWLGLEVTTAAEGQALLQRLSDADLRDRLAQAECWIG